MAESLPEYDRNKKSTYSGAFLLQFDLPEGG